MAFPQGGPRRPDAGPGAPASPEPEKKKKILRGVQFARRAKPDGTAEYVSSDPNRKIAVADTSFRSGGIAPETNPDARYDVLIIRDTEPGDPAKGKYIVKIPSALSDLDGGIDVLTGEVYGSGGGAAAAAPDVPMKTKTERERRLPLPIQVDEKTGTVLVLETELPLASGAGRELKTEKYRYFALDRRTLETAEKVATAVELREPCLLEGETSTSKTSTIEYLAAVTGNEVIRLNLNGQTDTSELVGKFVPNDGQLQVTFEEALKNPELLSKESLEILGRANKDGRALTLVESQKIAEREGMKINEWRWQDGLDIRAKKEGKWLILDEINLAEPQILERLNSQLDRNPSITLSENGGQTIRELDEEEAELWQEGKLGNVHPLDKNFRIFGTMNPAEYSGRAPMSPAFKDRWTSYKNVESPRAEDYVAMMELMVYGEQPEVEIRGTRYKGEDVEPLHQTLGEIGNFRSFLPKLAKFQVTLENLAKNREIGKDKKERYIFTRRGLIEFLGYLENKTLMDRKTDSRVSILDDPKKIILRAIQYYYLDKIANADDLKKVKDQLDAIGISADKFTHKFEEVKKKSSVGRMAPSGSGASAPVKRLQPLVFQGLEGANITRTGKVSSGNFAVGDVLAVKPEYARDMAKKVTEATELKVVGFDERGAVIVQLAPGGEVISDIESDIGKHFDIKEKSTSFPRAEMFTSISGATVEAVVGETGAGPWLIGDYAKLKAGVVLPGGVAEGEKLKYVGNDAGGFMIIQKEDGKVFLMAPPAANSKLEGVAPTPEAGGSGEFHIGDKLKPKPGNGFGEDVVAKVLGVSDSRILVEINGNAVGYSPDDVGKFFDKIPATPSGWPKEFTGLTTGVTVERTDELTRGVFTVGDSLERKPGQWVPEAIKEAKKLEVAGFTKDGDVIVRIDGGKVIKYGPNGAGETFDKIPSTPEAPASRPQVFTDLDGGKVERNDIVEIGGFRVGDLLEIKAGVIMPSAVRNAAKLEVVGFTGLGNAIVQIDGGDVAVYRELNVGRFFDKIPAAPSGWPREFTSAGLNLIVARTDELEREGYRVGDRFKAKPNAALPREILNAKKLELVGFTKGEVGIPPGKAIIQIDSDKVLTTDADNLHIKYEKISPSAEAPDDGIKRVTTAEGIVVELNALKRNHDFMISDRVELRDSASGALKRLIGRFADALENSKELTVVGFMDGGYVVIGLDSGKVVVLTDSVARRALNIINENDN